jgi:hypothetical protein
MFGLQLLVSELLKEFFFTSSVESKISRSKRPSSEMKTDFLLNKNRLNNVLGLFPATRLHVVGCTWLWSDDQLRNVISQ